MRTKSHESVFVSPKRRLGVIESWLFTCCVGHKSVEIEPKGLAVLGHNAAEVQDSERIRGRLSASFLVLCDGLWEEEQGGVAHEYHTDALHGWRGEVHDESEDGGLALRGELQAEEDLSQGHESDEKAVPR